MNKEEIFNQYAIEQRYESWSEFISDQPIYNREEHYLKVTDLIQEELKNKVSVIALDSLELYNSEYEILSKAILNTEIL